MAVPPSAFIPLAAGGAPYRELSLKVIRFIRRGCRNRPFFHIAVQEIIEDQHGAVIEQLGSYDPLPNVYNEKMVAINFDRLQHWVDKGVVISLPVKKLLGLSGYFPIHPRTYHMAWTKRRDIMREIQSLEEQLAASKDEESNSSASAT